MVSNLLKGYRLTSALVNLPLAAAANAVNVLVLTTIALAPNMVGVKTFKIKRIKLRNNNAGNTFVHVGTGVAGAFVDALPPLYSIANTTDDYGENDLPELELGATITAYPDAVGAGSFDIMVEAELLG